MRALVLALAFGPLAVAAQDDPAEREFQKKVDAAIDKGAAWLLKKHESGSIGEPRKAEILCLTLVHAGVRRDHPFLVSNINKLLARPAQQTYNAGLRAFLLEKLDRRAYQRALAELGMFFVDSQCENGQWTYEGKSRRVPANYTPTPSKRRDDGTQPGSTRSDDDGIAPGPPIRLPPPGRGSGRKSGDNSNSQYAVLGLFAAARANVELPKETLERAQKCWESKQNDDGGWGYGSADVEGVPNALVGNKSSGSMTTAGLTALIVCKFYLGKDWKSDARVKKGLDWLGSNLTYSSNPGGSPVWHYYYLYGLERVGQISQMKQFGGRDWYREGAQWLLEHQKPEGHWSEDTGGTGDALCDDVVNTCFAILFLRRATPELKRPGDIATGDPRKPKPEDKK